MKPKLKHQLVFLGLLVLLVLVACGGQTTPNTKLSTPTTASIPGSTERVSINSNGDQANASSFSSTISADGRFIAFTSDASNLVTGDTSGRDVFVHDRDTGTTERIAPAGWPSISANGQFVVFISSNSNLVPNDTNGVEDVFVFDRDTGSIELASVDSNGNQGNALSDRVPSINADGRFVSFQSEASNLVPNDTNNTRDIFVHDLELDTTERVSVDSFGNQANSLSGLFGAPIMSADGRFVAFTSFASNLVPNDSNGLRDVFVHDRETGMTERVSVDSNGNQGNAGTGNFCCFAGMAPDISADGRYVTFWSTSSNLVVGDTNNFDDVFVHDRETGVTERVSVDGFGNQANKGSGNPAISDDGRFVVFDSQSSNLVPRDTNDASDVFIHDRETGMTQRVSIDSLGNQGNRESFTREHLISADGSIVTFSSNANNLVSGDTNNSRDIFVHTVKAVTIYVSSTSSGNADGVAFKDEDILAYDVPSDSWSLYFDGSDVGFSSADLNAFHILDDDSLLLSFKEEEISVSGFDTVRASDIIRFIPSSLGTSTSGSFEWYFDGSDVDLSAREGINALHVTPEGNLILSFRSGWSVSGASGRDSDFAIFTPDPDGLGEETAGTWSMYFDGPDVNLSGDREDLYGLWIDHTNPDNLNLYITTKREDFSVTGLSGDADDIFIFSPTSLGDNTSGSFSAFWDGDLNGFADERVDGLFLQ